MRIGRKVHIVIDVDSRRSFVDDIDA